MEKTNVYLNQRVPAPTLVVWVLNVRKVFALYQDLDHRAEIDDELSNNEEPEDPFLDLTCAGEFEQVEAERNSRYRRADDTKGLTDELLFHGIRSLLI